MSLSRHSRRLSWVRVSVLLLGLTSPLSSARAEWNIGGGFEHFAWTEDTAPLEVEERGMLAVLRLGLSTPLPNGVSIGYQGRFFFGDVEYQGSLLYEPTVPVSSTTRYTGNTQQGRLAIDFAPQFAVTTALDLDFWSRDLGSDQVEDYRIVSMRLGAEHRYSREMPWQAAAGIKFTLSTHEDAHFDELGFSENPPLEPGQSVTPYLEVGYSFTPDWSIAGSYDGFSFGESDGVALSGPQSGIYFQPASDMRLLGIRIEYRPAPR
ncbi:MAG TPA: hypothetical protein VFQ05_06790 [Candidatus Eisenbacteria bacterium]|nr:hypothetical protein [Candidatus Eisenbacteria bacterium]